MIYYYSGSYYSKNHPSFKLDYKSSILLLNTVEKHGLVNTDSTRVVYLLRMIIMKLLM